MYVTKVSGAIQEKEYLPPLHLGVVAFWKGAVVNGRPTYLIYIINSHWK